MPLTKPPATLAVVAADVKAAVTAIGGQYLDIGKPLFGLTGDIGAHSLPNDAGQPRSPKRSRRRTTPPNPAPEQRSQLVRRSLGGVAVQRVQVRALTINRVKVGCSTPRTFRFCPPARLAPPLESSCCGTLGAASLRSARHLCGTDGGGAVGRTAALPAVQPRLAGRDCANRTTGAAAVNGKFRVTGQEMSNFFPADRPRPLA